MDTDNMQNLTPEEMEQVRVMSEIMEGEIKNLKDIMMRMTRALGIPNVKVAISYGMSQAGPLIQVLGVNQTEVMDRLSEAAALSDTDTDDSDPSDLLGYLANRGLIQ